VTLVAADLGNARFMAFDDKGILYLSRPDSQDVLTLKPNGVSYDVLNTYLDNYSMVQGLCWKNGWMYVSTSTSILKTRDNDGDGKADEKQTVLENLEGGSGHWWRSLLVTDDAIYTSVGDTSNISEQSGDREKIFRYDINGKNRVLWSSGIRNTEKLMLRPGTNEVWGGDQGSDWWGAAFGDRQGRQPFTDFNPPDEFNHYVQGGFYGHPYIMGNRVPRMEFATKQGVDIITVGEKTIVPAWCFGPHWAVDGFTFYTGNQFPADTKGDAFCGLHGSWNRKVPSGYRIERILFDKLSGAPYGSQILVGTLTPNKRPLARPVDVVQAPDGSLLFSSDSNGSLDRVSYVGGK
jgi:glucose/arabinose dehydrogenase